MAYMMQNGSPVRYPENAVRNRLWTSHVDNIDEIAYKLSTCRRQFMRVKRFPNDVLNAAELVANMLNLMVPRRVAAGMP